MSPKAITHDLEEALVGTSGCSEVAKIERRRGEGPGYIRMDRMTNVMVNLAPLAFMPQQIPQIYKNFTMQLSDPTLLQGLAWQGTTAGALGSLLLCTYFAASEEWPAARCQAICACMCCTVVAQIWYAGYCPSAAFCIFLTVTTLGVLIPVLEAFKLLRKGVFAVWTEALSVVGMGAMVAFVCSSFAPDSEMVLDVGGVVGFSLMSMLLVLRPAWAKPYLGKFGSWLATALLFWMPMPQIFDNFMDPPKARSFAIGFAVFAVIGNFFFTCRAVFTHDAVWFVIAAWGAVIGGWVQALSVYLAGFLDPVPFALYSLFLCGSYLAMLVANKLMLEESFKQQLSFLVGG